MRVVHLVLLTATVFFTARSQAGAGPVTTLPTPAGLTPQMHGRTMVQGVPSTPLPIGVTRSAVSVPLLYPANSFKGTSAFLSPMMLGKVLGLQGANRALHLQQATLEPWYRAPLSRALNLYYIDRNRMIYEVTTTFNTTYARRGNRWSSGRTTFIVDAQTGRVLLSNVVGHMTQNAGAVRAGFLSRTRR